MEGFPELGVIQREKTKHPLPALKTQNKGDNKEVLLRFSHVHP